MYKYLKPAEYRFKMIFFALTRVLLKRKTKELKNIDPAKIKKILILRPEKIGDMFSSFPVVEGLRTLFPHIKIGILGSPKCLSIIVDDPRFDKVFMYRKNVIKDIREIWKMRKEKYDCVVDMICADSVTGLYLSQLCAPGKLRIGVGKIKYHEFYDFSYGGKTGHILDDIVKLFDAFGVDPNTINRYVSPYINSPSMEKADRFINALPKKGEDKIILGYNLSAGSPTRLWPLEKVESLLENITKTFPHIRNIIICTKQDRENGERIISKFKDGVYIVPPGLNIIEVSAILSKLDILISPDTSLVHIARSFKVPVIGLYTKCSWNHGMWAPYGQDFGSVFSSHEHNIHDISVEQVFNELEQILKKLQVNS